MGVPTSQGRSAETPGSIPGSVPSPFIRPAAPDPAPGALGSIRLTPAERSYLDSALTDMTQRERDVVYALCAGGTNEEMARRLDIALPTLRTHLMRLNQKLRTSSKSDVLRHIASVLLEGYRTEQIQGERL